MTEEIPPIGSMWLAFHTGGEDVLMVVGDPSVEVINGERRKRRFVPCFVMTTGAEIETWLANFQTWVRLQ